MLDKIKFQTNVPEQVMLRHPAGKIVDGKFGQQVYYSLADGRCMYLDLDVAQKLNLLEPQAGEVLSICKRTPKIWDIWLSPESEQMRSVRDAGTIEQTLRASVTAVNENRYATLRVPVEAKQGARVGIQPVTEPPIHATAATACGNGHSNNGNGSTGASRSLVDEANSLVDAFAAVLERALTTYGGRIKPDDVRSLVLSAYIGRQKGGAHA